MLKPATYDYYFFLSCVVFTYITVQMECWWCYVSPEAELGPLGGSARKRYQTELGHLCTYINILTPIQSAELELTEQP